MFLLSLYIELFCFLVANPSRNRWFKVDKKQPTRIFLDPEQHIHTKIM